MWDPVSSVLPKASTSPQPCICITQPQIRKHWKVSGPRTNTDCKYLFPSSSSSASLKTNSLPLLPYGELNWPGFDLIGLDWVLEEVEICGFDFKPAGFSSCVCVCVFLYWGYLLQSKALTSCALYYDSRSRYTNYTWTASVIFGLSSWMRSVLFRLLFIFEWGHKKNWVECSAAAVALCGFWLFLRFLWWALCGRHGGSGRSGAGVEGLQVCLESQTILHFSSVSLQLSLVIERGVWPDRPKGWVRKHTHTHTHLFTKCAKCVHALHINLGEGTSGVSSGLIGLD